MAEIVVTVVDDKGSEVTKRRFIRPPKEASTILERLSASGYEGDLQNAQGESLCSDDPLDDTQEYRLLLRASSPPGMHYDWQVWPGKKRLLLMEQQWHLATCYIYNMLHLAPYWHDLWWCYDVGTSSV